MENKPEEKSNWLKIYELYAVVLTSLISYSGAGVGIGYLGYRLWGWPLWIMLITGMAGLSIAFYRIYQFTQREEERKTDHRS